MSTYTAEFSEAGGYDSMTGAWMIKRGLQCIVSVDQSSFGQKRCDYSFRSEEADRVAKVIVAALNAAEGLKE